MLGSARQCDVACLFVLVFTLGLFSALGETPETGNAPEAPLHEIYLRAPWSTEAPACGHSAPCTIVLGYDADQTPGLALLDVRRVADLVADPARTEELGTLASQPLVRVVHRVAATSALPRAGDAAMGAEGLNARIGDELRILASEQRDTLPADVSLVLAEDGPFRAPRDVLEIPESELETLLHGLGVERLALPATRGESSRLILGGRALLVGREPVALDPGGGIRVLGDEDPQSLQLSDEAIETILREGRIVARREVGAGITRPWRFTLQHEGRVLDAIFKSVDKRFPGKSKERNFPMEPYFIDSYRFERGAYLLDRMLDLRLVPVTVLRDVEGAEGALTVFVEGAVSYADWEEAHEGSDLPARLETQLETMRLLDALIQNTDRTGFNLLVTEDDLRLHAIDHSRSFRFATSLERAVTRRVPRAPEAVYRRLDELDEERAHEALDDIVGRQRVNALLVRRGKLLEAYEQDGD